MLYKNINNLLNKASLTWSDLLINLDSSISLINRATTNNIDNKEFKEMSQFLNIAEEDLLNNQVAVHNPTQSIGLRTATFFDSLVNKLMYFTSKNRLLWVRKDDTTHFTRPINKGLHLIKKDDLSLSSSTLSSYYVLKLNKSEWNVVKTDDNKIIIFLKIDDKILSYDLNQPKLNKLFNSIESMGDISYEYSGFCLSDGINRCFRLAYSVGEDT